MSLQNNTDNNINNNTVNIFNSIEEIAKDIINKKIQSANDILDGIDSDTYVWKSGLKIPFDNIDQQRIINDGRFIDDSYYYESENEYKSKYDSSEENMKYLLDYSLDLLKKYDIPYEGIDEYPENFGNRSGSCLCCNQVTFIIHCSKNNYEFDVQATDDCDCNPGIIYVAEIRNTRTNETYSVGCDLGCQNTGKRVLNDFLDLLNYDSHEHFVKARSDKWIDLSNKLSQQYHTEVYSNSDRKHGTSINTGNINSAIIIFGDDNRSILYIVPTDKSKIMLLPSFNYHRKFGIFGIKHSDTDDHKYLNDFCIHNDLYGILGIHDYMFDYEYDDSKFNDFKIVIGEYIKYITGEYGYNYGSKWFNHTHIRNIAKKYNMCYRCNIYKSNNIDVVLRLQDSGMSNMLKYVTMKKDEKYLKNLYELIINYDPSKDSDNIHTRINIYEPKTFNDTDLGSYQFDLYGNHTETIQYINNMANIISKIDKSIKNHFAQDVRVKAHLEKESGWNYNIVNPDDLQNSVGTEESEEPEGSWEDELDNVVPVDMEGLIETVDMEEMIETVDAEEMIKTVDMEEMIEAVDTKESKPNRKIFVKREKRGY